MPEYSGGLTGLAGDIGGIQDVGGRLTGEIMAGNEYNRLRNKEKTEEDRMLAKERKGEAISKLNIAMEHISKAKTPEEHNDAVKIYNTLGEAWTTVMGESVPMMAYNRHVIINLNSIINDPNSPESKKAIEGMSMPEQKIVMELIDDRYKRIAAIRDDKITGHVSKKGNFLYESGKEGMPAYIKPELTTDQEAEKAGKVEAAKQSVRERKDSNYDTWLKQNLYQIAIKKGELTPAVKSLIENKTTRNNLAVSNNLTIDVFLKQMKQKDIDIEKLFSEDSGEGNSSTTLKKTTNAGEQNALNYIKRE